MKLRTLVAPLFALVLTFICVLPAAGGVYYESTTTSESGKKPTVTEVRAWVDGARSKVEVLTGNKRDLMAPGTYLLTTDGGKTIYLVDPSNKTYQVWDVDALFATLGAVMQAMGGFANMTFSDLSSETLERKPGGSILGHSTTHVQWKTAYTFDLKLGPIKQHHEVEVLQDSWLTDAFDDQGFAAWLRKDRFKTGDDDLDRLIAAEMAKVEGFPLKSVVVTTTRNKKGKETTTRAVTEVTALRQESVADATFELPSGYERVEIAPAFQQQ